MARQLNCNLSGNITAPPVLLIDNGHRYTMTVESEHRGYFTIPDSEPGPFGAHILWANKGLNFLLLPPSWSYELTQPELLVNPPTTVLDFSPVMLPALPVGLGYQTTDGQPHQRRGMTGFCDLQLFQQKGEAGVGPVWQQAKDLGANERRVLCEMAFITNFGPHTIGIDAWLEAIARCSDLAHAYNLRLNLNCFADEQAIGHSVQQQQDIWGRASDVVRGRPNIFWSLGNELSKNGVDPSRFAYPGFPCSQGSEVADTAPTMPGWGDREWHGRRDWPKVFESSGDLTYVSRGIRLANGQWQTYAPQAPGYHSEPMGFAEVDIPNRRSTDPDLARRLALDSVAHGAGACFHSEDGMYSRPLGPIQQTCGRAFYDALKGAA